MCFQNKLAQKNQAPLVSECPELSAEKDVSLW